MSDFKEFARAHLEAGKCGHLLLFCSQFSKFGHHRIEVCEECKTVRHNDDPPTPLEVPNVAA